MDNVRQKLHDAKCAESRRKDGPGNRNLSGHRESKVGLFPVGPFMAVIAMSKESLHAQRECRGTKEPAEQVP